MPIRYPRPLRPGDRIGVTSPSSGVASDLRPRLEVAIATVRERGYDVMVGECMDGSTHISAPAAERAVELMGMLTDPEIAAIVAPWGGETAIDLVPLLDLEAIAAAPSTWLVGFSDISTIITPITLRTGMATLHGNNLMDTPYRVPAPLLSWLDIVTMRPGTSFTQSAPPGYRSAAEFVDFRVDPHAAQWALDAPGGWTRIDGGTGPVDVGGRLVGGCIETLANLAGTPFGDTNAFAQAHAAQGLIVYVEAAEDGAMSICRALHGMRLAGFFDRANAVILGRTAAPDHPTLTQRAAALDALLPLGVPIVADVECGHVPPYLPIVNGALGRLELGGATAQLTQTLA